MFTEREIYNWACTTVRDAASREPALKISTYWYNTTIKLQALDLYIAAGMDVRKQAHYNVHLPWSYPQIKSYRDVVLAALDICSPMKYPDSPICSFGAVKRTNISSALFHMETDGMSIMCSEANLYGIMEKVQAT